MRSDLASAYLVRNMLMRGEGRNQSLLYLVMTVYIQHLKPFQLLGDTVNVASRMESTGLPNAIQISYRVVKALPNPSMFRIITRGRIAVKGKVSSTRNLDSSLDIQC